MACLKPSKLDALKKQCFIHSDRELAKLCELSPETISRLRHGRTPKLDTLELISEGFNKRLEVLKKQHIACDRKEKVTVSDLI